MHYSPPLRPPAPTPITGRSSARPAHTGCATLPVPISLKPYLSSPSAMSSDTPPHRPPRSTFTPTPGSFTSPFRRSTGFVEARIEYCSAVLRLLKIFPHPIGGCPLATRSGRSSPLVLQGQLSESLPPVRFFPLRTLWGPMTVLPADQEETTENAALRQRGTTTPNRNARWVSAHTKPTANPVFRRHEIRRA